MCAATAPVDQEVRNHVRHRQAGLTPAAFGLSEPSLEDFEADIEFYAEADGRPRAMVLTAGWTQDFGAGPSPASIELTFRFHDLGRKLVIRAPTEVWEMHASADLGYQMAHPRTWNVMHLPVEGESRALDLFFGPVSDEIDVYFYPGLTPNILANAWFRASVTFLEQAYGVTLDGNEEIVVGGLPARLLTLHATVEGTGLFFQEAVLFGKGAAWDLDWYSEPGNEVADRERFLQFLSTFTPTGTAPNAQTADHNVWGLQPGGCFASLPLLAPGGESALFFGGVDRFAPVGCGEPHTGEVMAVLSVVETADCDAVFAQYVGRPLAGSTLGVLTFVTVANDNPPEGVEGLCVVADPAGAAGSAAGSLR
ncbi:MAG: hypothetical protein ACRDGJ_11250 [Candidatus Limnocylindria bacterium]